MPAAYLSLLSSGDLAQRAHHGRSLLGRCTLCPRECGVDRLRDDLGECKTGLRALVSSAHLHFGEESPLVGPGGSGTIFFAQCNLRCIFCQNYETSHGGEGTEVDSEQLAALMLRLQRSGAVNINLVSPSHVVPQILEALVVAAQQGLQLPIVYNSGGYDALPTLALLEGVVDIYMPDAKYDDEAVGRALSGVPHYPQVNRSALKEMHRQVGDLRIDKRGVAERGLLVRHLVLPEDLAGTEGVMRFLAGLSQETYVNVMDQYRPCFRAAQDPRLLRSITGAEYRRAIETARAVGLRRFAD